MCVCVRACLCLCLCVSMHWYVFNCVYGGKGGVCVHACMFSCVYVCFLIFDSVLHMHLWVFVNVCVNMYACTSLSLWQSCRFCDS